MMTFDPIPACIIHIMPYLFASLHSFCFRKQARLIKNEFEMFFFLENELFLHPHPVETGKLFFNTLAEHMSRRSFP